MLSAGLYWGGRQGETEAGGDRGVGGSGKGGWVETQGEVRPLDLCDKVLHSE